MFAEGDHFILTFTETIVCDGYLADANQGNGLTTATLKLLISFGGKKSFESGLLPGNLDYACQGNELKVSASEFVTRQLGMLRELLTNYGTDYVGRLWWCGPVLLSCPRSQPLLCKRGNVSAS